MAHQTFEIVRQPIAVGRRSRRRLEERLALRFPGALAFVARTVSQLRPSSRLRKALLRRAVLLVLEASNRGDFESAFGALYDPDCEFIPPAELVTVGAAESKACGREARRRFQRQWNAEWGEFRYEPEELIDLGDRMLVLGRIRGIGLSSGATFDNEWTTLVTIPAGRVVREQPFLSHQKGLDAAGLSE